MGDSCFHLPTIPVVGDKMRVLVPGHPHVRRARRLDLLHQLLVNGGILLLAEKVRDVHDCTSVERLAQRLLGGVADDHLQPRGCMARLKVSGVATLLPSLGLRPLLPLLLLTLRAGPGERTFDRGLLPLVLTLAVLQAAGGALIPSTPTIDVQVISEVTLLRDVADDHGPLEVTNRLL